MRPSSLLRLGLFCLLALSTSLVAVSSLPKPNGFINDFANVLDESARQDLTDMVSELNKKHIAQLTVVTTPSLGDDSLEEYAVKLFKAWGIGEKGKDNGVLVLIVPSARKMRIEVGYGLEGVLPDGLAGQVVRNDFIPFFKSGDFSGGAVEGVHRLSDILNKGKVLPKEWTPTPPPQSTLPAIAMLPFFGLFVLIGFWALGTGVRLRMGFFILWGFFFGGIPLVMSFAFLAGSHAPRWVGGILPVWAFLMLGWGLYWPSTELYKKFKARQGGRFAGGTLSSGDSFSSSSDSSSSGDSFGGGSSGGGGASGSW